MILPGTSWFWITAAMIAGAAVFLVPGQVKADWDYTYDDFSTKWAEGDSYLHSVFWPQGAFPPQEPYLYFLGTGSERELGFGGHHGEPAYLGYSFPTGPPQSSRAVSGSLQIDVRFLYDTGVTSSPSGYLLYSISADGVNWSGSDELQSGSQIIPIESVGGTCHIVFFGTEVLIDNLQVHLSAPPATIYVPDDFSNIQAAIDSSVDGDVVQVASGTYSSYGNRNIDFRGKAITVQSQNGPEQTIIDCTDHRGFYFRSGEGSDSVLRGFTIVGGRVRGSEIPPDGDSWSLNPAHPVGGGIFCEFSSPSIVNCVIRDCSAELGGGIASVGGSPKIIDCVIEQCTAGGLGSADSGGHGAGIGLIRGSEATIIDCAIRDNIAYVNSRGAGVYCRQSTALLVNCDISYNSARGSVSGGGLYCGGFGAGVVLENCLVSNNIAGAGGGIFAESFDHVRLTNCTVAGNRLSGSEASSSGGGIHSVGGDIVIRNSIVWDNDGTAFLLADSASGSPVLFSNIQGHYPGQGNIDADPLFASPATGDYHLQSAYGRYDARLDRWVKDDNYIYSPCIDAGDPQDPVGSEAFPNNSRINMGAYGGTTEASKSIGPLIFHVDRAGGNDFNTGLSRSNAFATIQRAVNETYTGDTVMVWPGVYQEQVSFGTRAITVQSADEAAVVRAPSGYAFSFSAAEDSRSVLRNFVIIDCGIGAVFCEGASPTLANLTMAGNQFGVVGIGGADPSITNCIFWNNEAGDLSQCRAYFSRLQQLGPLDAERGNISTDPLFADPDDRDYHLQSRYGRYSPGKETWVTDPLTSPCIDAGDPGVYPGRERTPHGGRVNMGAYGGTPSASMSGSQSWDDVNFAVRSNMMN
ncbi:MAG: right-handed parallel beta-helix repeat-containing protein [Phycisphaerae bacterium]|nr:right-handed parallel beta-helix repeat-containing protein [Phycisphaerae bacterium]